MDATLSSPPIPDRIVALIAVLSQAVIGRERVPGMTAAVIAYITEKLLGIHLRFRAVVARMAAGNMRPDKPRKKRARKPKPEVDPHLPRGWRKWLPKDTKEKPLWRVLRTDRFAWLCNVIPTIPGFRHSAALCGTHLRQLLGDPEMRAMLAASRRVGDSLRPLCWMLGVETALLYPTKPAAGGDQTPEIVAMPTMAPAPAMAMPESPDTVEAPPPGPTRETLVPASREGPETMNLFSAG